MDCKIWWKIQGLISSWRIYSVLIGYPVPVVLPGYPESPTWIPTRYLDEFCPINFISVCSTLFKQRGVTGRPRWSPKGQGEFCTAKYFVKSRFSPKSKFLRKFVFAIDFSWNILIFFLFQGFPNREYNIFFPIKKGDLFAVQGRSDPWPWP